MSTDARPVLLRIVVARPPDLPGTRFGVQDKSGRVRPPAGRHADSAAFEIEVRVSDRGPGSAPNFLGPYAHGTPRLRFLYLSLGAGDGSGWIKRIKVPLSSITWAMIEGAQSGALTTDVDGRRSGTVPAVWQPIESA